MLGDLNDNPAAATTQMLYGPPGSQYDTGGFDHPDQGDTTRLWNLAPKIPAEHRYSRVFEGQPELIDHILISHALLDRLESVDSHVDGPLHHKRPRRPPRRPRLRPRPRRRPISLTGQPDEAWTGAGSAPTPSTRHGGDLFVGHLF